MVLHNLFFLILACAVYFSLIPIFEQRVVSFWDRESRLVQKIFSEDPSALRLPDFKLYDYKEGSAATLDIPADIQEWLAKQPDRTFQRLGQPFIYGKDPLNDLYRRVRIPDHMDDAEVRRARITLFVVLGTIYVLAVLLLELVIMPQYVYQPLRLMLDADESTRRGDRDHELIDQQLILDDEIGQIMHSRNQTVRQLRAQEDDLARKNEMLETAKQNLRDQDRLVSLGMLSASVAHELNTPLAVLHGSIEKLQETVRDAPAQDRLARMLRVTQRLRKISESLVDFARVRRQEWESVPLRTLMEEAWGLVAIDEKATQATFVNEVPSDHLAVGNSDKLIQVFVNLLRNALHAIKVSGTILVRSRAFVKDRQSWIAVTVEDDGEGIPPDVLPDIFDAFVSTRLDSKGTGLGLAVAEGIIQQHGGTIQASNRSEGGARLEVKLRAVPAEVKH